MILSYTKILGLPVAEIKEQQKVGIITDVIFNYEELSVAGIIIIRNLFSRFQPPLVVTSSDMLKASKETVLISELGSMMKISELPRLHSLAEIGCGGVGQKVVSESGEKMGKVYDVLFEAETLAITRIYVKDFLRERIITANNILHYEDKTIIVSGKNKKAVSTIPAIAEVTTN